MTNETVRRVRHSALGKYRLRRGKVPSAAWLWTTWLASLREDCACVHVVLASSATWLLTTTGLKVGGC